MEIYTCTDDGEPQTLVSSQTLAGNSITQDGWYPFSFDITAYKHQLTDYLSFVLWQENGDEDNYALWGYSFNDTLNSAISWFSNDAVVWTEQTGILRALKVVGNFDPYDLTDFRIVTPTAESECIIQGN